MKRTFLIKSNFSERSELFLNESEFLINIHVFKATFISVKMDLRNFEIVRNFPVNNLVLAKR